MSLRKTSAYSNFLDRNLGRPAEKQVHTIIFLGVNYVEPLKNEAMVGAVLGRGTREGEENKYLARLGKKPMPKLNL